jgi:hypothetical protein
MIQGDARIMNDCPPFCDARNHTTMSAEKGDGHRAFALVDACYVRTARSQSPFSAVVFTLSEHRAQTSSQLSTDTGAVVTLNFHFSRSVA